MDYVILKRVRKLLTSKGISIPLAAKSVTIKCYTFFALKRPRFYSLDL